MMPQSSPGLDGYPSYPTRGLASYPSYRAPRHGSMKATYGAIDESTEGCARVCQLVLFLVVGAAVTICILSILSCEFLIFLKPVIKLNNETNATIADLPQPLTPGRASFGLFYYKEDIENDYCYAYQFNSTRTKPLEIKVAQWGGCLAAGFAGISFLFLLVEFCCCRFMCSRVLVHFAFFAGASSIVPVFGVFASGNCNLLSSNSYACSLGDGAYMAIATSALLLISMCFSCMTPKAKPIFRLVQEREQRAEHDPCVCGCGVFGCCSKRTKEDIYRENPELLLAELPTDYVEVPGGQGGGKLIYKHYYDDLVGGATLQSQYAAASQRWLASERDYQTMLDRFKQECLDLQSTMANNSSQIGSSRKLDDYFDDEDKYSAAEVLQNSDWRVLLAIPPEHISDAELSRLAQVLRTLRENCQHDKAIMDRIEADLEEHIKSPDDKLKAALLEIELSKNAAKTGKGATGKKGAPDDSEQRRTDPVHDAPSETERHANTAFSTEDETPLDGEDPRPRGSTKARLIKSTEATADSNKDQSKEHASMDTDVFSSFSAPADLPSEDQYFMDAEQPPPTNSRKSSSAWLNFKLWGAPEGDYKKTS